MPQAKDCGKSEHNCWFCYSVYSLASQIFTVLSSRPPLTILWPSGLQASEAMSFLDASLLLSSSISRRAASTIFCRSSTLTPIRTTRSMAACSRASAGIIEFIRHSRWRAAPDGSRDGKHFEGASDIISICWPGPIGMPARGGSQHAVAIGVVCPRRRLPISQNGNGRLSVPAGTGTWVIHKLIM